MFQDLIKKKGLLGGKYSRGLEEEVNSLLDEMDKVEENSKAATGEKKRKFEEVVHDEMVHDEMVHDEMDKEVEKDDPGPQPNKQPIQEGGLISSPGVGFIRIETDDSDVADIANIATAAAIAASAAIENEPKKKSKLTAVQYLARPVRCKVENRSSKANLNSMKTKFLTVKKKVASIQQECGMEQDFMLIMKNNLQKSSVSCPSPTAGKYMVYNRGNIRDQLLGEGVKFNPMTMFMLANDSNYKEEKLADQAMEENENEEIGMATVRNVNNVH